MYLLYDLAVLISWNILKLIALFNPGIRKFVVGRKNTLPYLQRMRDPQKPLIWMHTASLGEFEQGAPVLEKLCAAYPEYQFLITFFSPSGYEIKKDKLNPHLVTYLPMDGSRNCAKFLSIVRPEVALFVKYEVWPGMYRQMARQKIPILLISAIFRKRQAYFKWYGGLLRGALRRVTHFYVQDTRSEKRLKSLGINAVTVSGDTRFDRVLEISSNAKPLAFMKTFKGKRSCFVAGSSWPVDHRMIAPYINQAAEGQCFVLAPHKIDLKTIEHLEQLIEKKTIRYSDMNQGDLEDACVLILDTIGLLSRTYPYAEIAYVGGGFGTGLHNTLEPAVYGLPILIGPGYHGFLEAEQLVRAGGIRVVQNTGDFEAEVSALFKAPELRSDIGKINEAYIQEKKGASDAILKGVQSLLG
ncbi:3-deoxy-D-manno-octulosonic acid transferase [Robiginitalea aurantiaca]|uniref:3-deoxy-D-manno-octulosonic acid transferase n=1 Tax=Robiginitalea aurantiaca TaxID=3056915 RepID=A0ABT7WC03_9FLAO|nr:glycosyltransferase N-terminal domain-containing protein [Robiginitalea aurantiaca]MDM9630369.1 glycosyltransferase N-terminal domain-containing protein [Robiginitalea aurantiaca]